MFTIAHQFNNREIALQAFQAQSFGTVFKINCQTFIIARCQCYDTR